MPSLKSFFFRKKRAPLACSMSLDSAHVHSDACFAEIRPLSIVELFQSQGCASCPPAIPLIHEQVVPNPNALLLTYDVTYWDAHSGWVDTFGDKAWDARQKAYVTRWGRDGVFTPQVVVDGVVDGVGRKEGEVMEIFGRAVEMRNGMDWGVGIERVDATSVRVASERVDVEELCDVLLVTYDPVVRSVKVGKGTSKGKKVRHANVVKDVSKIEEWRGGVLQVGVQDFGEDGFERVVILQQGSGGPIVAALKM